MQFLESQSVPGQRQGNYYFRKQLGDPGRDYGTNVPAIYDVNDSENSAREEWRLLLHSNQHHRPEPEQEPAPRG